MGNPPCEEGYGLYITGKYCTTKCAEHYYPSEGLLTCKGEILTPPTWECLGGGIYADSCPFLLTLTLGFYVFVLMVIFVLYKAFDWKVQYSNRRVYAVAHDIDR